MRIVHLMFALIWMLLLPAVTGAAESEPETKARSYFTDTVLTTHTGKQVRFYSDVLKDKVVLINFIYTHCEDACPLITAKLRQAKEDLGELFGSQVRFVSISIDPERDTPKALAGFARKQNAEHDEWLFLTGTPANVEQVVKKLGSYTEDVEGHSTGIIIGNPARAHWKKVRPDAPPKIIALELRSLAGVPVASDSSAPAAAVR